MTIRLLLNQRLKRRVFAALGAVAAFLVSSCGKEDNSPALPDPPTNIQLVLSNLEYRALRLDGGFVRIPGGTYGLIVYRQNASTYRAFERLCPYQPQTHCAKMNVDPSTLFMRDSCCGTQWNFSGEATGGPGLRPLKQYTTVLSGSVLYITN
jgi:hypothetical protein